jgi:hypothetical protein
MLPSVSVHPGKRAPELKRRQIGHDPFTATPPGFVALQEERDEPRARSRKSAACSADHGSAHERGYQNVERRQPDGARIHLLS